MLEFLGPDLQPVVSPSSEVGVVKNVSSGQEFLVLPSLPPQILDVTCHDNMSNASDYTWSRITGDMKRKGHVAFNLNPTDGSLSGTPHVDLSSKGRGSLDIDCSIALGGQNYDKALPVLSFTVKLHADVCFVPDGTNSTSLWNKLDLDESSCLAACRKVEDCAAVVYDKACFLLVSNGTEVLPPTKSAMLRLDNCSEDETSLQLEVPQATYVKGKFDPSNVYKSDVSYIRSGNTVERQLVLARNEATYSKLPSQCSDAAWLLLHTNGSDFINGSAGPPEFFGSAMACAKDDVVEKAFKEGAASFQLEFSKSELEGAGILDKPDASPSAQMKLSVPSCAAPDLVGFDYGTVQDPGFYSLKSCECFGSAHASQPPVTSESNEEVPRNKDPNESRMQTYWIAKLG